MDAEKLRLQESDERKKNWQRWGPYLSERQWGTVREDYSADGDCWNYFPFDHAASRAYRWGEDGLLGICDRECRLCFSLALWNTRDSILKERLFGLNTNEGNHGEDVKECYYYLDSTPTHSYMKALYKYPQQAFPYEELQMENQIRNRSQPEFELADTGIFLESRYFDVTAEYAKASPNDILIRLTVTNRGPDPAPIHVLPTLWFRNTWIWGCKHEGCWQKPMIQQDGERLVTTHQGLEPFVFEAERPKDVDYLFTENESNTQKLWNSEQYTPYVKDAFHRHIINADRGAVSPKPHGTKVAVPYQLNLNPGEGKILRLRLCIASEADDDLFGYGFDAVFAQRKQECDAFHDSITPAGMDNDRRKILRQAFAGLLWSKQFYHYVVEDWLDGDSEQPAPPEQRKRGRNCDWRHLFNRDIISMPDKWEYPWYASWDLAFHMLPFALIDQNFAKDQLLLFLREWYMHPNGQIPAYEFALGDVNPPVHGWSALQVYEATGATDHTFLARIFQKLLINFTWWVNRKDPDGNHVFSGGFLGMDNVGLFDRSRPLPTGDELEQADGTAWMAFYCVTMLSSAMKLAPHYPAAEDTASKFFEHFVAIADAMNTLGGSGLWDEEDGFYYDRIIKEGESIPLKIRSIVGIIPLLAVDVLSQDVLDTLPGFSRRMNWLLENREDLGEMISYLTSRRGADGREHRLLAIPSRDRLVRVLRYLLDENEFLSPFGIRSLSKYYENNPFVMQLNGTRYEVRYSPGESDTEMFGGNSNWRGPVWLPLNYLLIASLRKYHEFFGADLTVECPTGSGRMRTLTEVADDIARRLQRLFLADENGRRPALDDPAVPPNDPHWNEFLLFHEYFHAETGRGLGASHQTGWTALIANLLLEVQ